MEIDVFSADEMDGVFRVLRTALNPTGKWSRRRGSSSRPLWGIARFFAAVIFKAGPTRKLEPARDAA